jgi:hypothetical protein
MSDSGTSGTSPDLFPQEHEPFDTHDWVAITGRSAACAARSVAQDIHTPKGDSAHQTEHFRRRPEPSTRPTHRQYNEHRNGEAMIIFKADHGWWHVYVIIEDESGPEHVLFYRVIGWEERGDGCFDPITVIDDGPSVTQLDMGSQVRTENGASVRTFVMYSEEQPTQDDEGIQSRIDQFKSDLKVPSIPQGPEVPLVETEDNRSEMEDDPALRKPADR